jgi:hypothetical protein
MQRLLLHWGGWPAAFLLGFLVLILPAHGQDQLSPIAVPQPKPLVQMTGFLNAPVEAMNIRPVLTLKLPGEEKFYTFLLTDMKIMAGPFRTPDSILSEVKPYKPNFHIRASREITAQLVAAQPTAQLVFRALYSKPDRVLIIENLTINDEIRMQ